MNVDVSRRVTPPDNQSNGNLDVFVDHNTDATSPSEHALIRSKSMSALPSLLSDYKVLKLPFWIEPWYSHVVYQ
jgi:hypothetical protein